MGLNFPDTPTVGQIFPSPAISGTGQWRWDGTEWLPNASPLLLGAPFDAMMHNNLVINGGMEVSQVNGTSSVTFATGTGQYMLDQWLLSFTNASAVFAGQQITPPGTPSFGASFPSCLQFKATTAISSLAAGDFAVFYQPFEGYRVNKLGYGAAGAQAITIAFWVYATIAGTFGVNIHNAAANRSYVASVSINNATTWEYKTVVIPGDVTGTWPGGSALSFIIMLTFACGTTFTTTPGAWTAGNLFGVTGQTNFFGTANNVVCLTGFGAWAGYQNPVSSLSQFYIRPFVEENTLCERYYQIVAAAMDNQGTVTNDVSATQASFRVLMRATPTCTGNAALSTNIGASNFNVSGDGHGMTIQVTSSATGRFYWYGQILANARM
jgi:hypothetical protein